MDRPSPYAKEIFDLFCNKYDELKELVELRVPYNLTKASAIIRQLLINGTPLMNQANAHHKLKITFPVSQFSVPDLSEPINQGMGIWIIQDTLYPPEKPTDPCDYLRRDQFLSKIIMLIYGMEISIKDVIKFEANVKGGVHLKNVLSKDEEKIMEFLANTISILGDRPTRRIQSSIGKSVIEGLKELRQACSMND